HRPAGCRQHSGNNPHSLRALHLGHQGQRLSAPDHHHFGHRPRHDRGLRPVAPEVRLLTATRHAEPDPRWTATLTTFAGLLLGVFVTLSSVGAGAIGMTALVLLYPRTPIARLVGSDIAHAVPLTLIAGVGHWLLGS